MKGILIKDIMIITMEDKDSIIKKGYILVEDDKIKEVKEGDFCLNTDGLKVIDGSGCAALPGFINCHTHIPMTLLRGYGEGLPLMRWLNEKIWPFEAKLTDEDIYKGARLGMIEMIKSGTTSFVDMYYKEKVIGRSAEEIGMRAFLGSPIIGDAWEKQIEETIENHNLFKSSSLVSVLIAPHSPYTCRDYVLREAGETARKYNMPVHIHIAETEDEINIIKAQYNCTPVEMCEQTGIFNGSRVIAAHCVHVNDDDIDIMSKYPVTAVYNPQSNMKLASGVAPVVKMMKKGINAALGTDGASSNNNLNMIEEMQTASYLQKLWSRDATALGAYEALKLATVNGAKGLGLEDKLGKIKEGYTADIVIMDMNKPHLTPMFDVFANIVFASSGSEVKTVIINGNVVMEDYNILTADESYIIYDAKKTVEEVLKR